LFFLSKFQKGKELKTWEEDTTESDFEQDYKRIDSGYACFLPLSFFGVLFLLNVTHAFSLRLSFAFLFLSFFPSLSPSLLSEHNWLNSS
jgi:hypothetical protein